MLFNAGIGEAIKIACSYNSDDAAIYLVRAANILSSVGSASAIQFERMDKDPVPNAGEVSLTEYEPSNGSSTTLFSNGVKQKDADIEKGSNRPDSTNSKLEENAKPEVILDDVEVDPWALVDAVDNGPRWAEMTCTQKTIGVLINILKFVTFLGLLYLFICALGFLGDAFKLLGGKAAGATFRNNEILTNPVAGMMIGVLATVLVQSSSTSTSITITMVGAGIIPIRSGIYIVMGSNIGTSVTNTIVAMAHVGDRNEFRRAFAGATVHDMFNWLSVIVLLPLEAASGYLFYLSKAIVHSLSPETNKDAKRDILKVITKPFTKIFVEVDKDAIKNAAQGKLEHNETILSRWCDKKVMANISGDNGTWEMQNVAAHIIRCDNLFARSDLGDSAAGVIVLVGSLILIVICLLGIVKILHSLLKGSMSRVIRKSINASFPGKLAFLSGYVAILVGAGMTMLVQSSSIFTSTLTPLVGVGLISIERTYPLTLGSNIGTTITGVLAALAADGDKIMDTLQVAFCHLFFNISGIALYYPIPFMRIPIGLAKHLGNTTAKYRWFAIVYLFLMFLLIPAIIFGLSMAGWFVLLGVGVPILILILTVIIINVLQRKRSKWLPYKLRNWDFLPLCMHSLRPLDSIFVRIVSICKCGQKKLHLENSDKAPKKEPEMDSVVINKDNDVTSYTNKGFESERL